MAISFVTGSIQNNESYIMIESEVYFEPYLHVLQTLRDTHFPQQLAMSKYIVNVEVTFINIMINCTQSVRRMLLKIKI